MVSKKYTIFIVICAALGTVSCTQRSYIYRPMYAFVPDTTTIVTEKPIVEEQEEIEFTDVFSDSRLSTLFLDLGKMRDEFCYPIEGEFSSGYGARGGRMHSGLDLRAPSGTPIFAIFDGEVTYSGRDGSYGNVVVVRHYNGLETLYAHNSKVFVKKGDEVKFGQKIALCGKSGNATGNHLHLETRVGSKCFDPELLLDVDNYCMQEGTLVLDRDDSGAVTATLRAPKAIDQTEEEDTINSTKSKGVKIDGKVYSAPKAPEVKEVIHTVKRGDTLSEIAERYSVSVAEICKLNNITNRSNIKIGQKLKIK